MIILPESLTNQGVRCDGSNPSSGIPAECGILFSRQGTPPNRDARQSPRLKYSQAAHPSPAGLAGFNTFVSSYPIHDPFPVSPTYSHAAVAKYLTHKNKLFGYVVNIQYPSTLPHDNIAGATGSAFLKSITPITPLTPGAPFTFYISNYMLVCRAQDKTIDNEGISKRDNGFFPSDQTKMGIKGNKSNRNNKGGRIFLPPAASYILKTMTHPTADGGVDESRAELFLDVIKFSMFGG